MTVSGLNGTPVVFIEWKVPSFAFAAREIPKEQIWCNVLHAVDGAWGIAGQALTNQELAQSAAQG